MRSPSGSEALTVKVIVLKSGLETTAGAVTIGGR
jgi:hypothetical protein